MNQYQFNGKTFNLHIYLIPSFLIFHLHRCRCGYGSDRADKKDFYYKPIKASVYIYGRAIKALYNLCPGCVLYTQDI